MSDTSRVDPKPAALFRAVGQELANQPPVNMHAPYEPHRRILDARSRKATSRPHAKDDRDCHMDRPLSAS